MFSGRSPIAGDVNVEFDICLYDSGGVSLFYLTSNCFCYETRMFFLMLALGVCGVVMQSCDDDDDNLKVPENCSLRFSQKYPEASPKWKTGVIITLRISGIGIMIPRHGLLPVPFG